jgi:hypothetical protein
MLWKEFSSEAIGVVCRILLLAVVGLRSLVFCWLLVGTLSASESPSVPCLCPLYLTTQNIPPLESLWLPLLHKKTTLKGLM